MKKIKGVTNRIAAMFLSGMLVVGAVPGTVLASESQADIGQTSEIAAELPEEINAEEISEEMSSQDALVQEEAAEVQYYNVTLDANGGYFENEWDDALNETVERAEVVEKHIPVDGTVATFPVFTDSDGRSMVFAGWTLERDGEIAAQSGEGYAPVDNCVLYAVWEDEDTSVEDPGSQESDEENTDEIDAAQDSGEAVAAEEIQDVQDSGEAVAAEEIQDVQDSGEVEAAEEIQDVQDSGEVGAAEESQSIQDYEEEEETAETQSVQDYEEAEAAEESLVDDNPASDADANPENIDENEQAIESDQEAVFEDEDIENSSEKSSDSEVSEEEIQPEQNKSSKEEETVREDAAKGVVESGVCGDNLTWTLDEEGTLTVNGSGNMSEWTYSDSENDAIAWFAYRDSIKRVEILQGITSIGYYAFGGCTNLEEVSIPDSVSVIETGAFWNTDIRNIYIPGNNVILRSESFGSCYNLKEFVINSISEESDDYSFVFNYTPVTNFTVMSGVVYGKGGIKTVNKLTISDGVTGIGEHAFEFFSGITEVEIPDSVTYIGGAAFRQCTNLSIIKIGQGLSNIQSDAFIDCTNLKTVTFTGEAPMIASNSFKYDTFTVYYPIFNDVAKKRAWYDNRSDYTDGTGEITWVRYLAENITGNCGEGGESILWELDKDGNFQINGLGMIPDYSLVYYVPWYDYTEFIKEVEIEEGITRIGSYAFSSCENMKHVLIPDTISSLGYFVFSYCRSLEEVRLPEGLTEIPTETFSQCTSLKKIVLPETLKIINGGAFYKCNNLADIVIPDSVETIWPVAFQRCTSLKSIIIPSRVNTIGSDAFEGCSNLESVRIKSNSLEICYEAFRDCTSLHEVIFEGNAPAFLLEKQKEGDGPNNAFLGDTLTAYYPDNNATWTSEITQDYGGQVTWKKQASDITKYTITYDVNGGTGTPSSQIKNRNVALTLSNVIPTKKYVISYNANGGRVSPASKNINCTFKNWNTSKNGSGTSYASGGSYTADADVTLYAQWTNPKAGDLASPTRSGYMFVGWFTSASGGELINDASTISKNMTVYAHWTDPYNLGDETYSFQNYGDSDSRGGHCFGMSITSSGYYTNLLDIGRIGGNANTPLYSFDRTQTVKRPICYYQGRQGSYSANAIVAGGSTYLYGGSDISSDWQAVVNYVKSHKYDNTGLLQIGFRKNLEGGHAINFLRYENINGQDRSKR